MAGAAYVVIAIVPHSFIKHGITYAIVALFKGIFIFIVYYKIKNFLQRYILYTYTVCMK